MYNGSIHNDNMIKSHTSEPYPVKDGKGVTESQNTIVVSKKKHEKSFIQKIKAFFTRKK